MHEYRELMARQRAKKTWATAFGAIITFVLCVGAAAVARTLFLSLPEPTPTVAPAVAAPTSPPATLAPMPTHTSAPTSIPLPTETASPAPTSTPVPSPQPSPTPLSDPQGDVGDYDDGTPVAGAPSSVDIRTASVGADLRVALQPADGIPAELAGWAAEDDVLLWISLYGPVPDPPAVFTDWVFVLDLDGDTATGRPVGAVRANPDLGYEAAIGVSYNDATAEYEPYLLVWDSTTSALTLRPDRPRFILNKARTLVGLALSLGTLTQTVEQTAGVVLVPAEVRGRAAAQSRVGVQKVIDFYPDRPD